SSQVALTLDNAVEHGMAGILEVEVVDPVAPTVQPGKRVTAPEDEVAGVQGKPDAGAREQLSYLSRSLDIGAGVVVERHLKAQFRSERRGVLYVGGVAVPLGGVQAQARSTAWVGPALRRT